MGFGTSFGISFGIDSVGAEAPAPTPPVSPPTIDGYSPTGSGISINTNIYFTTKSGTYGVDSNTIDAYVDGSPAILNGIFQSNFDGILSSIAPNAFDGYDVVIDPIYAFDQYNTINIDAYCSDLNGNSASISWDFLTQNISPIITPIYPTNGSLNIPTNSNIIFTITDEYGGIKENSIDAYVDGYYAIINGIFQVGYDGISSSIIPNSQDGYNIIIDPTSDFSSYSLIEVEAFCEDINGATASLTWSFQTVDTDAPIITPISPTNGEVNISRDSSVSFNITDDSGSGVKQNSIDAYVDGYIAIFSGVFQTNYDGPSSSIDPNIFDGYDIVIDPTYSFDSYDSIIIDAYCKDSYGNSASQSWSFSIEDYIGPLLVLIDPLADEYGVDKNINIQMRLIDAYGLKQSSIKINIDGYGTGFQNAYDGSIGFISPYNGPSSNITGTIQDMYITIDPTFTFTSYRNVKVQVIAEDLAGNSLRIS